MYPAAERAIEKVGFGSQFTARSVFDRLSTITGRLRGRSNIGCSINSHEALKAALNSYLACLVIIMNIQGLATISSRVFAHNLITIGSYIRALKKAN